MDLVRVPLAPACVKGDISCANVVDLLSRVTPYSWSEGLIFPQHTLGRKEGPSDVSPALCMVLLLLYSVQVAGEMHVSVAECSYFDKGHCNVEFILCLCKWQQLLNVAKGQRAVFSKEKAGMTINPME